MDAFERRNGAAVLDDGNVGRVRQECAHDAVPVFLVAAEVTERIGMVATQDRIGFSRKLSHAGPPSRKHTQRAAQRDPQPVRPVGQFVFDFVERLLEQEEAEQIVGRGRIGRPQPPVGHRSAIGRQECVGAFVAPLGERGLQLAAIVGLHLQRPFQRRADRIIDRADQSCDVARGRRLHPPLGERAARLALEVDDEDVFLDDQHLAEMEVAVMADIEDLLGRLQQGGEPIAQAAALLLQLLDQWRVGLTDLGVLEPRERTA